MRRLLRYLQSKLFVNNSSKMIELCIVLDERFKDYDNEIAELKKKVKILTSERRK